MVTVADDGPGIAPEQREEIFRWGHRADTGTPGNGYGLATVRRLARAMGGEVTVSSAETDSGTTFVLELPRA
jgi:signal transduction histidine kinase